MNLAEQQALEKILKRQPNNLELKLFAALWSEHCSYKSTKIWLNKLYSNEKVLTKLGQNAGAIDIGNNLAVIFKIESHNHPSYISPYHGAATGVGGILRDIFTMGAKPIALMNFLQFGDIKHQKTNHLIKNITRGIGDYGNSFGVPMIGGKVRFDADYNKNILVNVFCAGIAEKDKIIFNKILHNKTQKYNSEAAIFYLGAKTKEEGCDAAIMASKALEENNDIKQDKDKTTKADPFMGRLCFEVFQELLEKDLIIASTDLGGGGLGCAIVEFMLKNQIGINLDLSKVPIEQANLTYEKILLSETQERILLIIEKTKAKLAQQISQKWGLELKQIAEFLPQKTLIIKYRDKILSQINLQALNTMPKYRRDYSIIKAKTAKLRLTEQKEYQLQQILCNLLSHCNKANKEWFFSQFDSFIQGNSITQPGEACAIVKINDSNKALAFKLYSNSSYCRSNSYNGTTKIVTRCYQNLQAVGAKALGITNNLNFGDPTNKILMGDIIASINAMNKICKKLDMPIISGNISLYNQTANIDIPPSPVIVAVGLINDLAKFLNWQKITENQIILLLGKYSDQLNQSLFQQIYLKKATQYQYPKINVAELKKQSELLQELIEQNLINYAEPTGSGGIILSLAKISINKNIGIKINIDKKYHKIENLFGESSSNYLIFTTEEKLNKIKIINQNYNLPLNIIGKTEKENFILENSINIKVEYLSEIYNNSLEAIFNEVI